MGPKGGEGKKGDSVRNQKGEEGWGGGGVSPGVKGDGALTWKRGGGGKKREGATNDSCIKKKMISSQ